MTAENDTSLLGALGGLTFAIGTSVIGAVVARDLYVWFAMPLGAPPLTLAHIFGLLLLKGMVVGNWRRKEQIPDKSTLLLGYLLMWGLGAIAAGMMP